jgi:hypothetical protein
MPDKKLIDFEKLKEIRYLCSKCDKLVCEKFGCPIWNSLPDVPEPDQSKGTERLNTKEQPMHASSYRGKEAEVAIEEAIEG